MRYKRVGSTLKPSRKNFNLWTRTSQILSEIHRKNQVFMLRKKTSLVAHPLLILNSSIQCCLANQETNFILDSHINSLTE